MSRKPVAFEVIGHFDDGTIWMVVRAAKPIEAIAVGVDRMPGADRVELGATFHVAPIHPRAKTMRSTRTDADAPTW